MKQRYRMHASYVQTLIYYDGPRLALLQNRKGTPIVALAANDAIGELEEPFIAKPTTEKIFSDYVDQKIDLSFLMRSDRGGDPFVFDWAKLDDEVLMDPAELVVKDVAAFMPRQGLFARNHTERLGSERPSTLSKHVYQIDGKWTASDFSKFYAKLSDLYSLFSFLKALKDSPGPFGQHLTDTISHYPWQGGGSYLNFFKDIASESRDEFPLQVSKIQYASPGTIEVKGVVESLSHIDEVVRHFDNEKTALSKTYNELRNLLQRENVLGSDAIDFSNLATAKMAGQRADTLFAGLKVGDTAFLRKACGHHLVTYSKIALAVYRRGQDFHKFHAEGRMQLPA